MIRTLVLSTALVASSAQAQQSLDLGLDIVSSYIFRGETLERNFVAQPSATLSVPQGISLGVWANHSLDGSGKLNEVDYTFNYDNNTKYFGYGIGYTEYTYPEGGDPDREATVSFSLPILLSPSISLSRGLAGAIENQNYAELGFGYTYGILESNTTVGYSYLNKDSEGLRHATFQMGLNLDNWFKASVGYVQELDEDILDLSGQDKIFTTTSLSHSF